MKKLLASIGLWLALTTGALAACPVGWTGLGSCDTLLDKLTNADVNAALGATITLGSGKTFTVSNTLAFTGTDSTSFAFPSASGTVATLAATQTLANKTLTSPTINGGALSGTLTGTPTFSGNLTFSGVPLFTGLSAGTVVKYVGLDSGNNAVLGTPAGGSFANPSATAGPSAVNGSATTAMRSDAAPAVQKGTNAQFGIIEGDGSTITCVTGVCSAIGGAATSIVVGTTTIGSGTTGHIEYNNGGVLGELATGTAASQVVLGGVITAGGPTGSATVVPIITYNAAGQLTTVSSATITPAVGSITGLGTGVASALGDNIGSAGAPVVFNGAGGTPSSLTLTNAAGLPTLSVVPQITRRTTDANYAMATTDQSVTFGTTFTASRTLSLLASTNYTAGQILDISDDGAVNGAFCIIIAPNGTDTINGTNASIQICTPYGAYVLQKVATGAFVAISANIVAAFTPVTHQFLTGLSAAGAFSAAQPACGDLSNSGTGCQAAVASGTSSNGAYYSASSATISPTTGITFSSTAITSYIGTITPVSSTACTLGTSGGCSGGDDCGTMLYMTGTSAVITIPATLAVGCQVAIVQAAATQVSITGSAVSAATLHTPHSFAGKTAAQYSTIGVSVISNAGGSSAVALMTGDGA